MLIRNSRFGALLFALFVLLGLAASCSNDDGGGDDAGSSASAAAEDGDTDDTGSTGPGGTGETTTTARPGEEIGQDMTAQRQRYCEVWGRITAVNREAYNDDDPNSVKAHYNKLIPIAEELEGTAPDDIKPKVQELLGYLRDIAGAGDENAVDGAANSENGKTLRNYAERFCDAAGS